MKKAGDARRRFEEDSAEMVAEAACLRGNGSCLMSGDLGAGASRCEAKKEG